MSVDEQFPEHVRLAAVQKEVEAINEFLDWAADGEGWFLARWVNNGQTVMPLHISREAVIAKHFGIDRTALEAEKREMLRQVREANGD